ncbi:MAG: glycosyl transferase family 36, partial [Dokdonella sp.]
MSSSNPAQNSPARMCWLGNGRHALAIDASGSGFSRSRDLAITRWREDATTNHWGSYVLLRDRETGAVWSATRQPCLSDSGNFNATLSESRAEFVRIGNGLKTTMTVAVCADADAEMRRITIVNQGERELDLDITSYAELVLGSAAADASHPAFSKIFMQTEWDASQQILLATRRQRTRSEASIWAAHFVTLDAGDSSTGDDGSIEYESDRAKFLGRGRTLRDALSMQSGASLSNTVGYVLDPIFSLRQRVRIAAGASATIAFWTVAAESRAAALDTCRALRDESATERALVGADKRATADANRLAIATEQVACFQQLIAPLLVADTRWRTSAEVITRAKGGAPLLWASSISGDRPIVLESIANLTDFANIEEILAAQRYWQAQRLGVDVVLLNCAESDAAEELQSRLDAAIEAQRICLQADKNATKAEVFALRSSTLSDEVRDGLRAAARIALDARTSIEASLKDRDALASSEEITAPGEIRTARSHNNVQAVASDDVVVDESLQFVNGYGGFHERNREYSITLTDGECTPLPWINVVANAEFGFFMSAEGGGNTWSQNSQQNPLTPWPNDPVSDTPHDVLYLRD